MKTNPEEHNQKGVIRIKSPARTCLFGDHQDYMYLPVIACAIDRHIDLTATPIAENHLHVVLPDINKEKYIALDENFGEGVIGDHLLAAYKVFKAQGGQLANGYKIIVKGNVAINAGISSSSAVVVGWVNFLLAASSTPMKKDREYIAQLAYEAEVTEQRSPGGRMDQYAIALGDIIYLETDDNASYETYKKEVPGLIVGESGIPKPTLSLLGELRTKAWEAIKAIQNTHPDFEIADARNEDLDTLLPLVPEPLKKVFEAAVCNHSITRTALTEIRKEHPDMALIGSLINEHHALLRDNLGITVPLIDKMIEAALDAGALGAKIVGSGLGGSIIALAPEGKELAVIDAIKRSGARDAYLVATDPGVRIV
ncbi:GHMP family kinase ATP-binding protein [Robertkochia sediminum]|uniref:GHMP family kinase ATP-binding protein n=1 Tax=Robertkochia sediminum TaxID=2785326 RepID=UPI0019315218|nr:galactokinase family protein [Robertkochia sediminum]MBL7471492.1 galactokinase [Robertkochia sediminum]